LTNDGRKISKPRLSNKRRQRRGIAQLSFVSGSPRAENCRLTFDVVYNCPDHLLDVRSLFPAQQRSAATSTNPATFAHLHEGNVFFGKRATLPLKIVLALLIDVQVDLVNLPEVQNLALEFFNLEVPKGGLGSCFRRQTTF